MGDELAELRRRWQITIQGDGGACPCCDRYGKIHARGLNLIMVRSLVWLDKAPRTGGWVNVPVEAPHWVVRSRTLPWLRWWELIERKPADEDAKKHSGMWATTDKGERFIDNKIAVPKSVYIYNDEVVSYSKARVYIDECIDKFRYDKLMSFRYEDLMREDISV